MIRKMTTWICLLASVIALMACQSVPETNGKLTSAQIAALMQEGFVQSEEGWEFSATDKLLFGLNEVTLLPSARQTIERIARLLASIEIPSVRVDGHTDATGSVAYNDQLSLRRAQAVRDVMVAADMPVSGVRARGLGSRIPVANNQTLEGRAQNRRVVVVIVGG